jgi:DNA-binding NtrC family response regulator
MRVLIVDDERSARRSLERLLEKLPFVTVAQAASAEEARAEVEREPPDVALVDLRLDPAGEERSGLALVGELRSRCGAAVIVVTGSQDIGEVRAAMRQGAHDYILKDELSEELVLPILEGLHQQRSLEQEVRKLRARAGGTPSTPHLVGTSRAMQRLRRDLERVALSDRPVLVLGPTGAGKEMVVRTLHSLGEQASHPLLDLNCGALPPALIESQLFGHERGAFTGADRKHTGFFAAVGKGLLFLDEVAELPLELQAKLLRVLETHRFRPVGATADQRFEGRIVAATHADLEERVARGAFREDLYYRLSVLEVHVPSLEERREDVPTLVAHFAGMQRRPLSFTEDAIQALQAQAWPGNVRQLRNLVDRLAVFAPEGPITREALEELRGGGAGGRAKKDLPKLVGELTRAILQMPSGNKLDMLEAALVDEAMRLSDGNKAAAARLLGVHRKMVERRTERASEEPAPAPLEAAAPREDALEPPVALSAGARRR